MPRVSSSSPELTAHPEQPPPPQQARSREAMRRLLASAEHVLIHEGAAELTIAKVADHAGVSVGGIYRRFANKEQLIDAVRRDFLTRLENSIRGALTAAGPSLEEIIVALTTALGDLLSVSGRIIPSVLAMGFDPDAISQGHHTAGNIRLLFYDTIAPYRSEICHSPPDIALSHAFRTIFASGAHRVAAPWLDDGLTWTQWSQQMSAMVLAYLTSPSTISSRFRSPSE